MIRGSFDLFSPYDLHWRLLTYLVKNTQIIRFESSSGSKKRSFMRYTRNFIRVYFAGDHPRSKKRSGEKTGHHQK